MKEITLNIDKSIDLNLKKYNSLNSTERGKLAENIVRIFLEKYNFNYESLENKHLQKLYGDFLILNKDDDIKFVEVKNSHTFFKQNKDKLALDFKYYVKGTKIPYFQAGSDDNKGYLEYIRADIVIAFNHNSNRLYVINKFQELKKNILNLIQDHDEDFKTIEYITDLEFSLKKDGCKDSIIINLDLNEISIERLGGKLTEFELKYNLDNKKNTLALVGQSISSKRI